MKSISVYVGPKEPMTWLRWMQGAHRPVVLQENQILRRAPVWNPAWQEHVDLCCYVATRDDLPAPHELLFVATGHYFTEQGNLRSYCAHPLCAESTDPDALVAAGYVLHDPAVPRSMAYREVLVGAAPGWCPPLLPGQILHCPEPASPPRGYPVSREDAPHRPGDLYVVQGPGVPRDGGRLYPVAPLPWDRPTYSDLLSRGIAPDANIISDEVQAIAARCSGDLPSSERLAAAREMAALNLASNESSYRATPHLILAESNPEILATLAASVKHVSLQVDDVLMESEDPLHRAAAAAMILPQPSYHIPAGIIREDPDPRVQAVVSAMERPEGPPPFEEVVALILRAAD